MKVRKAVRKIIALGFTSAMIGATLLGAANAADLKDFPRPLFVDNNGVFSGKFVVGAAAAAEDVLGVNSIATAVQAAAYKETSVSGSGGSAVSVEGDAYQIKQGSNILEIQESVSTVKDQADKDALKALAAGKFTSGRGTYDYDQYLKLPVAQVTFEKNSGGQPVDDSDKPAWFLKMNASSQVYEYQLKFVTPAESDESTTPNRLKDFENKKMNMLGKEMSLIKASNSSGLELTFMGGAIQDTLQEGQSKTYKIDGKDYEVTLVTVDSNNKALFKVNGETTDTLLESDTYRLSDNTEMGIKTVLTQNFAEGKRMVEFYLGAEKIVMSDASVTDSAYGGTEVKYNNDRAYDTDVKIDATPGSTYKLNAVYVKWTPRDTYYLGKDVKFSSVTERKGQLFLDGFDYAFKGVNFGTTEKVDLSPSGDRQYYLNVVNYNGDQLKIPYVYTDGTTATFGTSSDLLTFNTNTSVAKNNYFLVSKLTNGAGNGRSGYTYLMRYRGCATSSLICSFRNEATGDTIEVPITASSNPFFAGSFTVGGNSFYFAYDSRTNDQAIYVDLTSVGSTTNETLRNLTAASAPIYTKYGAQVDLGKMVNKIANGAAATSFVVSTEKAQSAATGVYDKFNISITQDTADDSLNAGTPTLLTGKWAGDTTGLISVAGSDDSEAYSQYGLYIHKRTDTNNPSTVNLVYPDDQAEALVYVSSGETTTTSSGTPGGVTSKVPVAIPSSASVLDTEVSNAKGQNLIVVGGPCANSVSAAIMGVTDPNKCAEGFVEGKGMVKLYDSADGMATGKVALLVAGYSAADTRRAAIVVANYKDYAAKFMGKELTVTGTSLTDISVAAAK
jgi:hypothetical protein